MKVTRQQPKAVLYYFHDPMCSWCWAFKSTFHKLCNDLDNRVIVKRVLGGLAADNNEIMSMDLQEQIRSNWQRIETAVSGVKFNFDFWNKCQPRRSTYAACRAVIAARQQGQQFDELMTSAIQQAYYQEAKNPSEDDVLIELAAGISLDKRRFIQDFYSSETNEQLMQEISFTREMFVESFPSLVLVFGEKTKNIEINYNNHQPMLDQIKEIMNAFN